MDLSMDFITGISKLGNKSIMLVFLDKLSKHAHFCALPHPFTPALVAQYFMDQIFKLHAMPTSIVSDHDLIFRVSFGRNSSGYKHIGEVAYKLALPPTAQIHPVFHVSRLKKVIGNHCRIQTSLPEVDEEGSIWLQLEQVLDTREQHLHDHMIKEVLVKWKDTSPEDPTREPTTILQQFPQLQP
eukprot:PITA_01875